GPDAVLAELNTKRLSDLFNEVAKNPVSRDPATQKVVDYYASFMDEAAIEKKGLQPLEPVLAHIAAISDRHALAKALGETLRADVDALNNTNFRTPNLLGLWVAQDLNDPTRYAPFLMQGGLSMPDRDYYLSSAAHMAEIRQKYQAHIVA